MKVIFIGAVLAVAWVMPAFAATTDAGGTTVSISTGPLRGKTEGGVSAFLGIPYAAPPVGNLRWRSPRSATAWKVPREATHFGTNCFQGPPTPFGPYTAEFLISPPVSEDCLYLNVWTPRVHDAAYPVYVFIHGGGFDSGSSSIPIYNGANLASRGVVVVTINYRLGVLGYLAHPDLTRESEARSSGNYGLQDIIAALHWVHDNIRLLGGDPSRVTIAGQSAGAAVVNDLLVSKPAKGLFARAVAESGSGMGVPTPSLADAEKQGIDFIRKAGAADIQALREMPASELQRLTSFIPPKESQPPGPPPVRYAPNVDGVFIARAPVADATLVSNVPLLTGFNADEGQMFGAHVSHPADLEAEVRKRYGDFAERFLALYPHATDAEATQSMEAIARDRYMSSLAIFSEVRATRAQQLVFNYLFDHPYPDPNAKKYRAFHTAEVPFVLGALRQEGRHFSDQDSAVSRQVQAYWVNFITSGNPNGDHLVAWRSVAEDSANVMELGDSPAMRPAVTSPERLALFRDFVKHGGVLSLF